MDHTQTERLNFYEPILHLTENRPFSIHYTQAPKDDTCALYFHCHSEYELFYLEEGDILFHVEDQVIPLKSGQALLLPPFTLHGAEKKIGSICTHYAFVFSSTYLTDSVPDTRYLPYLYLLTSPESNKLIPITGNELWEQHLLTYLKNIFSCYEKPLDHCELLIHGNFLLLCQELVNYYAHKGTESSYLKLSYQLEPALRYIHLHFSEMISLEQLAAFVYLSREQFCRSFKKLTGVSAFTYLNRYRIQKSCEYLTNTHKKIAEIASLCGFSNISYFNREFKKYMHLSPKQYRDSLL